MELTITPLDRPEERDLRVLAVAAGIDRLSRANLLSPYETTVALKVALRALLETTRAPIAMIHQCRGLLRELEVEQGQPEVTEILAALTSPTTTPETTDPLFSHAV